MSRYGTPFCSDEELLEELNKLGYDEVSPDVFSMMKDDLSELVEKEQNSQQLSEYDFNDASPPSPNFLSSSSDALIENRSEQEIARKSDSSVSRKVKKKSQNKSSRVLNDSHSESNRWQNVSNKLKGKSSNASLDFENLYDTADDDDVLEKIGNSHNELYDTNRMEENDIYLSRQNSRSDINKNDDIKYGVSKTNTYEGDDYDLGSKNDKYMSNPDVSVSKYRNNGFKESKYSSSKGKFQNQAYVLSNTQKAANDDYSTKTSKDAFKTFKLDKNSSESIESLRNYRGSDFNLNTSGSSTGSEIKTMKRKVLRRRNGRSIITEELVQVPDIFDTSYPESENLNSSKSFSSDDLSCKSNSSTGSITAISPETIKSSPSTLSLTSTRSTSFRIPNSRKKKSDPVAMYGYYRKFWDNFKPPGENTHDRLRWAIRDKMLEYNI